VAVCLAVPTVAFLRILPPPTERALVVANDEDVLVDVVGVRGGTGRAVLAVPPLPALRDAVLRIRMATFTQPASARVLVRALDGSGAVLSRCDVPAAAYADNATIACPVVDTARLARVAVGASGGQGRLAIYAHARADGPPTLASLEATTFSGGRLDRVREAWRRLGVTRPLLFGPAAILLGTVLSLLAVLGALVVAARVAAADDG
jgi:hypothetical protein